MIYFMQEDNRIYRVWPSEGMEADYKIITVEQFVQVKMVCALLHIEMMELSYVNPSLV